MRIKYPKTSRNIQLSCNHVVVTEKLDGENTTLYHDYVHARSLTYQYHISRTWVKRLQAHTAIPYNYRICGENMFAKHSIFYDKLPSYFFVFAIFVDNICLSWQDTIDFCSSVELHTVPVLYEGPNYEEKIESCYTGVSRFGQEQEGYIVRNSGEFKYEDFQINVGKFVRPDHVKTDEHWMNKKIINNILYQETSYG